MGLNLGEVMVRVGADLGPFKAAMQGAQGATKELGAHLEKTSGAFHLLEIAASAAAAVGLTEFTKKSLEMAMEGERTMARVKVAFGEGSAAAIAWANDMHRATGISVDSLLNVRSNLQSFSKSLVGSANIASEMSAELAPLATDISKIYGVDAIQAAEALRSGLAGNAKALGDYGIAMNETALKEYAHSKGIRGNITDLTEAQQGLLRFNFIMDHAADIQKAAAGATDTFSNKLSILKGGVGDLAQAFGEALFPSMKPILDAIGGIVGAIKEWIEHHKKLTATIAELVLGLGAVATAIGAIALLVTPLFALSAPILALMASVAALALVAVYFYETWKKNLYGVREWVYKVADGFKEFFNWIVTGVKGIVADFVEPWLDGINLILTALASMGVEAAKVSLAAMPKSVDDLFGLAADGIEGMKKEASGFVDDTKKMMLEMVSTIGEGFKDLGKDFSDMLNPMLAGLAKLGKGGHHFTLPSGVGMFRPGVEDVPGPVKDIGGAAQAASEALLSAIPALHDLTSAAAKGAELGGVWGAVISVFGQLLSKSESFKKIVDVVTKLVQKLADALNPVADGLLMVVEALAPVLNSVTALVGMLAGELYPIFFTWAQEIGALAMVLAPLIVLFGPVLCEVLTALAESIRGVAIVVVSTVLVIATVWNGVISVVQKVISDLSIVVGVFSADAAKAMKSFSDSLGKSKMDTGGITDDLKNLLDPEAAQKKALADAKAAQAADNFADSAQAAADAAESLTNVPTGFKIALARFSATMGIASPGASSDGVPDLGSFQHNPGAAAGMQTIMNGDVHVTIQTNDPDAAWRGIKKAMARDSFLKTGAGVMSAPRLVGG